MAEVRFEQATRIYPGSDVPALDALDLEIGDGELMVLVGPSGSGKTTALRMLAGLEDVDAGAVYIDGRDVSDDAPKRRDVAMVFQNYALYPYLTVADNMGFPLRVAKVPKSERQARVREVAELLELTPYLERKPGQLSGGQRQRVAMGRAIVRQPRVFLMDEPLSNLDAKLRVQMRADIAELQSRLGVTTVYVTHDQAEAMTLGHRVAVLKDARLQQCDTPRALFDRPVNTFVAAFIGSPAMNLAEARLDGDAVELGSVRIPLPPEHRPDRQGAVVLGVRPESFEDAAFADRSLPQVDVRIAVLEDLGSDAHVIFPVDAPRVETEELRRDDAEEALIGADGAVFTARVDARTGARPGETMRLAVDPAGFHWFDRESGASLPRRHAPLAQALS
jgi:multiple sugar transport system ATP-binding protein